MRKRKKNRKATLKWRAKVEGDCDIFAGPSSRKRKRAEKKLDPFQQAWYEVEAALNPHLVSDTIKALELREALKGKLTSIDVLIKKLFPKGDSIFIPNRPRNKRKNKP